MDDVQQKAAWMRAERKRLSWSTGRLASEAKNQALLSGVEIKLSQQTISAFEQGNAKREPSWYRYAARALGVISAYPAEFTDADVQALVTFVPIINQPEIARWDGTPRSNPAVLPISTVLLEQLGSKIESYAAVNIDDNSMAPELLSGDQVIIDRSYRFIHPPGSYCLYEDPDYVVRFVERVPSANSERVRMVSRNSPMPPIEADVEDLQIVGRVVWFGRKIL